VHRSKSDPLLSGWGQQRRPHQLRYVPFFQLRTLAPRAIRWLDRPTLLRQDDGEAEGGAGSLEASASRMTVATHSITTPPSPIRSKRRTTRPRVGCTLYDTMCLYREAQSYVHVQRCPPTSYEGLRTVYEMAIRTPSREPTKDHKDRPHTAASAAENVAAGRAAAGPATWSRGRLAGSGPDRRIADSQTADQFRGNAAITGLVAGSEAA
jgi:hypothetical protein